MHPLSLAVYCGSRSGTDPRHRLEAERFGTELARQGVTLVYGGGSVGLMGAVADATLAAGGRAIGVIPEFLVAREVGHRALSRLIVVPDMRERKRRMFEMAEAFVILPGGIGTLEEYFEVLSWRSLGLHDKPILVVDSGGFWRKLAELMESVVEGGFAPRANLALTRFVSSVDAVLPALASVPDPARRGGVDLV